MPTALIADDEEAPRAQLLTALAAAWPGLQVVVDAVHLEADSRCTGVVYSDRDGGGEALIRTPLKALVARLDAATFWQIDRSTVVNHRRIASAVRIAEGHLAFTPRNRCETLPMSHRFQGLFCGR